MNLIKKQWQKFKEKTLWGKFSDIFFIVFIAVILTNDGRVFIQQAILSTGIFGNLEKNTNQPITEENWQWKLYSEEGEQLSLETFKGKKIFINTWATWCPPCNAEMPYIIELMKQSLETEYLFVTTEKPKKVIDHLEKKGWDIPVYFTSSIPTNELNYSSLPTTFIIDENGVLIHKSEGMRKWNDKAIVALLNE